MNKVGHAALQTGNVPETKKRYKTYDDEPLNPRISNPAITGNSMVMDIDRVPHTVQLPDTVVEAYNAGALPLNCQCHSCASGYVATYGCAEL